MATVNQIGVAKRRSDKGEATRAKILDAAEVLFADRGYYGVSLRDITTLAEVENALASYHFGAKERLFVAVMERRAAEHREDMIAALEAAIEEAKPGLPTNQALVKAYASPAFEKIARGDGWAAYIRLIVGVQNLSLSDRPSALAHPIYDDTIRRFIDAFVMANPLVPKRRVHYALYFLHGTFIHLMSQGRAFERLLDDGRGFQDSDETIAELAELFAVGLNNRVEPLP